MNLFHGSAIAIPARVRDQMVSSGSWRPGCPVSIEDLRLLRLDYWGFDGRIHGGELVVNRRVSTLVLRVFRTLFDERFPIRRMERVDAFEADDDRSMAADNSSGFNCRGVPGSPGVWSEHASGLAIDVNPVENPEVQGSEVSPPAGAAYLDRSMTATGMIHAGDEVVRAFASIGWHWGGDWHSLKDYQHFSWNGR